MRHCTRPVTVKAISWTRTPAGWQRWMVRECQHGWLDVQALHWHDLQYAICMGCFAQDARLESRDTPEAEDDGQVYLICNRCNQEIRYVSGFVGSQGVDIGGDDDAE